MDLFIYSDESGVFDKVYNEIFVYGRCGRTVMHKTLLCKAKSL